MAEVQLQGRRGGRAGVPVPRMAPWPLLADVARESGTRPDDVPVRDARRRRPGRGPVTPARHRTDSAPPKRGRATRLRRALGTALRPRRS